jgi:hypothetical protein
MQQEFQGVEGPEVGYKSPTGFCFVVCALVKIGQKLPFSFRMPIENKASAPSKHAGDFLYWFDSRIHAAAARRGPAQ